MRTRSKLVIAALVSGVLAAIVIFIVVPVVSIFVPDYRDIKPVIADADRILVREVKLERDVGIVGGKVLFEVRKPEEVQKVLNMMSFRTEGWRDPCRCTGYPLLEWRKGDVRLANTTYKHSARMHWVGVGDCDLDWDCGDRLGEWLKANGVAPENDPRQRSVGDAEDSSSTDGHTSESPSQ